MGRRGRAGQGEEPSLSDLPGHDCGLNLLIIILSGLGRLRRSCWGGYTMVGCSSPSVGKGCNWTKFPTWGMDVEGMGRVWGPSCPISMGYPKEAAVEGVDCGAQL